MPIIIAGKPLICLHCGGQDWEEAKAYQDIQALSHLLARYQKLRLFTCRDCAEMRWFQLEAPALPPDTMADETICLRCDGIILPGQDRCPACGWSYTA